MIDTNQLEDILQFYKCPCKVLNIRQGGGFCDYILSPLNSTTINKVQARTNDFCLALGQPVTIAFENMQLIFRVKDSEQPVYNFFEYYDNLEDRAGQIAFGINPQGQYIQYNLFDMPHLLVAGATGSGKSVFLHNAILSIAGKNHAVFTLIDLKRVELSIYNGMNFVDGQVITDAHGAESALDFEVAEMENRYKIMEQYQIRDYRNLPDNKKLTARVIVIDELADLMLNRETRKSVENSIVRIAQLGRAAGIHLILATQRPSTDVITGLIKANIPCKLAFMTSSAIDSRVIGVKGAENLAGRGDALLSIAGHKELERLQAFYIDNDTLYSVLEQARREQDPNKYTRNNKNFQKRRGFFWRLFGL